MSLRRARIAAAIIAALALSPTAPPAVAQTVGDWDVAVNNAKAAPVGVPDALFRSYNQPSINDSGVMVFRARAAVPTGEGGGQEADSQVEGVFYLDLPSGNPPAKVFARGDTVPEPNNALYNGVPAAFNEFPSTPRIDPNSNTFATRGQHEPVWTYLLSDDSETRVGTAGVYAIVDGGPEVAASQLGGVVELDQVTPTFPWFSVPATLGNTRFDQFPGSPAVDGNFVVWKGNYTDLLDGLGRTGIYYRYVGKGVPAYTGVIASSNSRIPNQPAGGSVLFGSTAPPSAANGSVYFTGLDIELAPTLGGIYRAPIALLPTLTVVASVGDQVPGEPAGTRFYTFGEGLSVSSDGTRVAFWATWGTESFQKQLTCPADGRRELIDYCLSQFPDGHVVEVPVNQGIFIHDAVTGVTTPIARTGVDGIEDFVFWGYSGRVPGTGGGGGDEAISKISDEGEEEFARWRSSAFMALSVPFGEDAAQIAFKAQRNAVVGIYLHEQVGPRRPLVAAVEVGVTPGTLLDAEAPVGSMVSAVAIERDGFRSGRLAITASMLWVDPENPDESLSWAGIYTAPVGIDSIFAGGFE